MGVAYPQEGCPVSICQVATVVADTEESVFVERVAFAIRLDEDAPSLAMKTLVSSIRTDGVPGPCARCGKRTSYFESTIPIPECKTLK